MQVTDCGRERRRDPDTNRTQCRDGLDLPTNCTTCLSPLPIQCQVGGQNCTVSTVLLLEDYSSSVMIMYRLATSRSLLCSIAILLIVEIM